MVDRLDSTHGRLELMRDSGARRTPVVHQRERSSWRGPSAPRSRSQFVNGMLDGIRKKIEGGLSARAEPKAPKPDRRRHEEEQIAAASGQTWTRSRARRDASIRIHVRAVGAPIVRARGRSRRPIRARRARGREAPETCQRPHPRRFDRSARPTYWCVSDGLHRRCRVYVARRTR